MFLFWLKLKLSKLHSFCHITWEHKSGIILLSFIVLLTSLIMLLFQQCPYISLNQWWHRAIFHIWLQPLAVSNKVLSYQKSLNYFSFAIYMNNDKITVRIFLEFTLGNFWGLLTVRCVFPSICFRCLCIFYILSRTANNFIMTTSFLATPYMTEQTEFISYTISVSIHHGQICSFLCHAPG